MYFDSFTAMTERATRDLLKYGVGVDPGRWQGISTVGKPDLHTLELINWAGEVPCDRPHAQGSSHQPNILLELLAEEIRPNRDWADEHFLERVGGEPLNPDPSHVRWPFWRGQDSTTKEGGKFTHTYSERFWPKMAGPGHYKAFSPAGMQGIRYDYGDYADMLALLAKDPSTRQAYLPIFFPEDTGARHGGRIPCTLGYHFLRRNSMLHLWYDIRSCDLYRHFRDDIYLAVRLMLHTLAKLGWTDVRPGHLYFTAHSLHINKGDLHNVRDE